MIFKFPLPHSFGASFDKLRKSGKKQQLQIPLVPRMLVRVLYFLLSSSFLSADAPTTIATEPSTFLSDSIASDKSPVPVSAPEAKQALETMLASGDFKPIEFVHFDDNNKQAQPTQEQKFYSSYLAPYYPRACVIGGYHFCKQTPEEVDAAIADTVKMFKDEPWFYFVDKPEQFNHARYWEYIVDQMSIMHEFLVRLRVDPVTKKIYHPAQGTPATAKGAKYLLDYLLDDCSDAAAQSIAIGYDYVNRLFIDAIKREDVRDAVKYLAELEYLEENLRTTHFDRDYHEHMTTVVRSLFELLKKRHKITDEEIDELRSKKKPGSFSSGNQSYKGY